MEAKIKDRILFLSLSLICGASFIATDFFPTTYQAVTVAEKLLYGSYVLFTFLFFKAEIQYVSNINGFLEILWKGFLTSAVFFILVFLIRAFNLWNVGVAAKSNTELLCYHLVGMSLIVYQGCTYNVFKKLSYYPKIKQILEYWKWFEYLLAGLLLLSLLPFQGYDYLLYLSLAVTVLLSVFLTVRIKWIVYLDFRQKLQALFMVLSVFLMGLYFLQLYATPAAKERIPTSFSSEIFVYCLFAFLGIYSVFTILILLFNLPTTSVFEKKYEELSRFQFLSDTLQQGKDRDQILQLLYESCAAVSQADAMWIRYHHEKRKETILIEVNVDENMISNIEKELNLHEIEADKREINIRNAKGTASAVLGDEASLLCIPIRTSSFSAGFVVLIKFVKDGFERDIINVLKLFTQQAAISLENTSLLAETLEKERYQEEIKISKHVQQSLLPKYNLSYDNLKICHYSKSSGTVGGDFFDYCTINGQNYWIAIGDVAGKGTAAAFLMAQLKGIFRSLVQVCSGPRNLVIRANYALSYNTERSSFITFSVFLIDTELKVIRHARAGHCQGIFYRAEDESVILLEPQGMGLGMIKDDTFKNFIEESSLTYKDGDILVLYTDGITECKNSSGNMFGLGALCQFIVEQAEEEAENIVSNFAIEFADFLAETEEKDDMTLLVIKFQ